MTVQQATHQLLFQLFHVYDEREANNIADLVMEKVTDWKRIDRLLNKTVLLSLAQQELLSQYIEQLLQHRPVQYILNEAWFYKMKFYVDENVLIPRPETEELANWLIRDLRQTGSTGNNMAVLDVGTGSGCIAIAVKKHLPGVNVYACDISEGALQVAKKNSVANDIKVDFFRCDFLNESQRDAMPVFDFIIANPPYIPVEGSSSMSKNVTDHEPHLALFVENDRPLIFYEALADFAMKHLSKTGAMYLEIHEEFGSSAKHLFEKRGLQVEIRCDLQRKERMLKVSSTI